MMKKSKLSWTNLYISWPLVKENLKRFKSIFIIASVIMFLGGPYSIINHYSDLKPNTVQQALSTGNIVYGFLDVTVPVIAALVCFSYLHKTNSATLAHSMPFTKQKLFISNVISGFIITVLPVLINTFIILCIQKNVYITSTAEYEGAAVSSYNMFNGSLIFSWMTKTIIQDLFSYSVCVLAAMISGTVVIQLLTGCALNLLCIGLYACIGGYCEMFIQGVTFTNMTMVSKFHPLLYFFERRLTLVSALIYLGISALILTLAYIAYIYRKNERAGDSYVYKSLADIIVGIIAFGFSTFLGLAIFDSLLGYCVGAVLGFAVGRMIITKSFRILNRKTLKAFAVTMTILALFICSIVFDIFGIGKYVPKDSEVESVSFEVYAFRDGANVYDDFTDPESIENVTNIHKYIVDNAIEPRFNRSGREISDEYEVYSRVRIAYKMKNGKFVRRDYDINLASLKDCEDLRILFDKAGEEYWYAFDAEFDADNCFVNIWTDDYWAYDFQTDSVSDDASGYAVPAEGIILDRNDARTLKVKEQLLDAIRRDLGERNLDSLYEKDRVRVGEIYVTCTHNLKKGEKVPEDHGAIWYSAIGDESMGTTVGYESHFNMVIFSNYENVMTWLEKYGPIYKDVEIYE